MPSSKTIDLFLVDVFLLHLL